MSDIVRIEEDMERQIAATQHCPFRIHRRSYGDNYYEDMMPCDPQCAALVYSGKDNSWSCLRLVAVRTQVNDVCILNGPED